MISSASLTVQNGICTNGGHNEVKASVVKSQDRFSSARNYKLRIDRVIISEKITLDLWILLPIRSKNDIFTSFRGSAVYGKTFNYQWYLKNGVSEKKKKKISTLNTLNIEKKTSLLCHILNRIYFILYRSKYLLLEFLS